MCQTLNRSKAALWLSVDSFFAIAEKPTFWTFTSEKVRSVTEAFAAWRRLSKALWHFGLKNGEQTIFGLVVAEMHPGGHGVHFHVLFNRRLNVHAIRRRAEKHGFWWIQAKSAYNHPHKPFAGYLGKYLTKSERPEALKGRKLWSCFGKWGQTRCKDVIIDTEFTRAFHHRRRIVDNEATIAEMQGKQFRKEHNLETMDHAKNHVFMVKTFQRAPLKPESFVFNSGAVEPIEADWNDWDGVWSELTPQESGGFGSTLAPPKQKHSRK